MRRAGTIACRREGPSTIVAPSAGPADGERQPGQVRVRGSGKAQDGEPFDCGRAGQRGAGAESSAEVGGDARTEQPAGGLCREQQPETEQQPVPGDVRGPGPRLPEQRLADLRHGPGDGGERPYEQRGGEERQRVGEQRNRPPEREQRTARRRPREAGHGGLGSAQAGVGPLQEGGGQRFLTIAQELSRVRSPAGARANSVRARATSARLGATVTRRRPRRTVRRPPELRGVSRRRSRCRRRPGPTATRAAPR